MSRLDFSLRGDREVRRLIDSLSAGELVTRTRRATRAGAAVMRTDVRARVRGSQYPRTFRKIATKSTTHAGPGGTSPGTSVGPTSPLHNIFEGGASGHRIAPRHARVLAGPIGEHYRSAPFVSAHPVTHPGMEARPLTTPAFEATKDEAAAAAMEKLVDGLARR